VLNVVANLVLIPRLGILGAAIGSLLSYTTYAAFAVLGLREAIRRPRVVEMLLPRRPEGEKGR
jgi:O-antigen/teichoic acid export membrane protein